MADSLCGPSNALQNFQKHSSVDRTLQQDRLIGRQPQLQGFRSVPGPNAGVLDPEFQAFQAGNHPLESQQGFRPTPLAYAPQNLNPGLDGTWASDFQHLQVSNRLPNSVHHAVQARHTATNAQAPGGWAQDFQQIQGDQRGIIPQQMGNSSSQFSQRQSGIHQYGGPMMGGIMATRSATSAQQTPETLNEAAFDEAAFDDAAFAKAFDDAFENVEQEELNQEQNVSQDQSQNLGQDEEVLISESAERFMDSEIDHGQLLNQAPIGADIIHDPTDKSYPQPMQEDHTELARTAGHLLNVVSESNNEKFANSQFMQLMRQLRDREVEVAGSNMVNSTTGEKIGEELDGGIQVRT